MPSVYLAGPIAGLTEGEANNWRYHAMGKLEAAGIKGISPLRCEPAKNGRYDDANSLTWKVAHEILYKNAYDVRNCDLTLAVLPKPTEKQRASYGTMWEVGASYVLGKPVVIVTDDPVITQHPLFGGAVAMWVVDNLDEALDKIISLLQDY